jgi:hypothetical protein
MFKLAGIRITQGLFAAAVLTCNIRFALYIGTDPVSTAIWVALAVGSAFWTMLAIDVAVSQMRAGHRSRAAACVALLAMALTYDGLAAYGLARIEQTALIAKQDSRKIKIAAVDARIADLRSQIAASNAPPVELAKARLAGLPKIENARCIEVTGPNRLSRAAANRVRAACAAQAEAAAVVAAAVARDRLADELAALSARKSGLVGSGEVRDARAEALPPVVAAMLPVLIMTAFAMLGSFATDRPGRAPQPQKPVTRRSDDDEPETPPSAEIEPVNDDGTAKPHLVAIASRDATEIAPLKKDRNGWVSASQRALAKFIGCNVKSVNSALAELRDAGRIELTTQGGTKFRLSPAVSTNFAKK